MGCSKRKAYKDVGDIAWHGIRQKRKQATNCQWKAYAIQNDGNWYLRIEEPEHNYLASAPKVFLVNCQFFPADMAIIKNDVKAHIPLVKTLA